MTATLYMESPTLKQRLRTYIANGYPFKMVEVQKGSFLFQGNHKITFPDHFEMGQYPVTQGLWEAVMGENPARYKGADRPVERVSWDDIIGTKYGKKQDGLQLGFLGRLNALPEIAALNEANGCRFGLPSEAQWEYAARGGEQIRMDAARGGGYGMVTRSEYAGSNYLPEVGWYNDNSQDQSHPVGRKLPNALGLYDMSGNVDEWCKDTWQGSYKDVPDDGSPLCKGGKEDRRAVRGGSWGSNIDGSRAAYHSVFYVDYPSSLIGFRLSRFWSAL